MFLACCFCSSPFYLAPFFSFSFHPPLKFFPMNVVAAFLTFQPKIYNSTVFFFFEKCDARKKKKEKETKTLNFSERRLRSRAPPEGPPPPASTPTTPRCSFRRRGRSPRGPRSSQRPLFLSGKSVLFFLEKERRREKVSIFFPLALFFFRLLSLLLLPPSSQNS